MNYKLKSKLLPIRQEQWNWCIPVCIEISLKYLNSQIQVNQKELWDMLIRNNNDNAPSFGIYKEILTKPSKYNSFIFEHWGPGDISELRKKIEEAIKNNYPVLLSMPTYNGWHIRVCHEITDNGVTMYNPGNGKNETELLDDIKSKTANRNGGDILIIGLKK